MNKELAAMKVAMLSLALLCSGRVLANPGPAVAADNTRINQVDNQPSSVTADKASNKKTDREIMSQIRRAVVEDKSLSVYAHNVKIISRAGKVTLKGTVHTEEEKSSIEAKAVAVAGSENITNQINVKGS